MHKDLIARFDRRVPRYTSYPTALQFHAGIGPADYARALGALDGRESTSLYLHVPFCDRLCWYCGCHTKIVARYTPVAAFATALAAEIDTVASRIPARLPARQIHWGGGTPTLLAADDFRRLMDRLRARFDVAANAEVAVEIDPRTLKPETVAGLADAGVTRASLGVQDFDPTVQEAVNRVQPLEMVREAVEALRGAGIGALNFDLMYGLPHQDEAGIRRNVELSLSLDPDRIALFGYAHVPWMKKHQRLMPEAALPDAEA
ncbi:MAG: coproporphyrinogen dehydrogenase, partial [Alphaproteobacteria bacterium]|nr:coproporphyrinogen dehydrogenase [Alphaproteobacteria bacterium]